MSSGCGSSSSCGSGGCGGGGSGRGRMPFFRFKNAAWPVEELAKLPRPLRVFVFVAPFVIVGNSIRFVRKHYIPDASLLPKAVEGEVENVGDNSVPLLVANNASSPLSLNTPPPSVASSAAGAAGTTSGSRVIFGQRSVPVRDDASGAVVGYRFASN